MQASFQSLNPPCVGLDLPDVHYEITSEWHRRGTFADIRKGRLMQGKSFTAVIIQKIHDPPRAIQRHHRGTLPCPNFHDFVDRIEDTTGTIGRALVFQEPLYFLSTMVSKGRGLSSPEDTVQFMGQLLTALTFLHDENGPHGHISPDVIFFEVLPQELDADSDNTTDINARSWILKLSFDVDQVLTTNTFPKIEAGPYCPPEVLESPKADAQKPGDLWSSGCVLAFMMYGTTLFDGTKENILAIMKNDRTFSEALDSKNPGGSSETATSLLSHFLSLRPNKRSTALKAKLAVSRMMSTMNGPDAVSMFPKREK
ncbi:kinase-like domain-containing protein [Mycena floridula]|nr:kinase-like domain-containing protein [Mycena floridula]